MSAAAAALARAAAGGVDVRPVLPAVTALYHHLHAHPELSGAEHATQQRVVEALAGTDVTVRACGGTGLVAVLRNGDGPVVALRGDTDALPIEEETGLPYASAATGVLADGTVVPVMHACGHDVHTAALVGALLHLDAHRDGWAGTVVGVFQPAEETGAGAVAMIEDGLFDETGPPDVVYGQHVTSAPVGQVVARPGWFLSHQRSWRITVEGVGGHASRPHLAKDPVVAAASMVVGLQTVVSRAVDPFRMAVLTVGTIHGGTKENVIPREVVLTVSTRTYEAEVAATVEESLRRVVEGEALAAGVDVRVEPISDIPACYNDPAETARAAGALATAFGADAIVAPADPFPAADDFSQYGARLGVPTVIWNFGVQDASLFGPGLTPPRNHDGRFAPHPTDAVAVGTLAAVTALRGRLAL